MVNQEQLALLRQGSDEWNIWRENNPTAEISLSSVDLSSVDLSDADLSRATLRYVNISSVDLSNAKLCSADLRGANLSSTDLSNANLSDANLSGVDLSRANLSDADLSNANLSGADLSDVDLSDVNLSGTYLRRAYLHGANLSDIDLSNANLSDANLSRANLSNANLSGANLSRANLSDANLSGVDLHNANFSGANLSGVDLHNANLSDFDLHNTNLNDADINNANLRNANLRNANLHNANLRNANLRNTDLRSAKLSRADMRNANLSDVNFGGADLQNANLSRADLRTVNLSDVNFGGADLYRANLNGLDLSGANLCSANLSRADLSDADLRNANLQNAKLSGVNLQRSRVLYTNFIQATFTGACIADWQIGSSTLLENVTCKYVFRTYDAQEKKFSGRLPVNPDSTFAPGEFTQRFQIIASALETIDITFTEGIDWQAFFQSFQTLRDHRPNEDISIQGMERKGESFVVRLEVETEADKAAIETEVKQLYTQQLDALEAQYQERLRLQGAHLEDAQRTIETERQKNTELIGVIGIVAQNQGAKYDFRNSNVGQFVDTAQAGSRVQNIQHIYAPEQQDLREAAKEIQALLNTLAETYNTTTDAGQEKLMQDLGSAVEKHPKWRRALKEGGIELIKVLFAPIGVPLEMARVYLEPDE